MSERGVFAVDRGIWDHPAFKKEPFTEREAWAWLIGEASFRPRQRRLGPTVFDLKRGQLVVSIRFLAERWDWQKGQVERFLERLKTGKSSRGGRPKKNLEKPSSQTETLIETQTETGYTVITICKYSKYQKLSLPIGTANETENETRTRQQRDKLEDTESTELDDDAVAPRGALVSPEALTLTEKLLVVAGHDPKFWPPGWCGAPMRIQTWLNQGWKPEIIFAAVKGAAARKRGPPATSVQYFENAIAEEMARQSTPLPVVEIREPTKLTVINGKPKSPIIQAADDLCRKLASFDGPSGGVDELRGSAGKVTPRLLSDGRGE